MLEKRLTVLADLFADSSDCLAVRNGQAQNLAQTTRQSGVIGLFQLGNDFITHLIISEIALQMPDQCLLHVGQHVIEIDTLPINLNGQLLFFLNPCHCWFHELLLELAAQFLKS